MRFFFILFTITSCVALHAMDVANKELIEKFQGLPLATAKATIEQGIGFRQTQEVKILLDLFGTQLTQQEKDQNLFWCLKRAPKIAPLFVAIGANNETASALIVQELIQKYQGLSLAKAKTEIEYSIGARQAQEVKVLLHLFGTKLTQQEKDQNLCWCFKIFPEMAELFVAIGANSKTADALLAKFPKLDK